MATPLLPLLRSVISDAGARADFLADPAGFLHAAGWDVADLDGAALNDALAYAAAVLPAADALVLDRFRLAHGDAVDTNPNALDATLVELETALLTPVASDLAGEMDGDTDGAPDTRSDTEDWFRDPVDSDPFALDEIAAAPGEFDAGDDGAADPLDDVDS